MRTIVNFEEDENPGKGYVFGRLRHKVYLRKNSES